MRVDTNANIHACTQRTVFDARKEERFAEYRRKWKEYPENFVTAGFPLHLDIESTSACNLRCTFCARTSKNWGPEAEGYMGLDLYRRIIDEGADNGLYAIKLSMRGEPLLHPQLHEMVGYAKKKGIIDVYFNTNATLLTQKKAKELIDAGLDRISISFEGHTKEIYESYRVGAKYEDVVSNIEGLRAAREQARTEFPQIRVQTVLLPQVKEEYEQYLRFWEPIADEVAYIDARNESSEDDHRGIIADWTCPFLWQRMAILWDGTLLTCSMWGIADFDLMALGNVAEVKIKSMWSGDKCTSYRDIHKCGRGHTIAACDRCAYRASEIKKRK